MSEMIERVARAIAKELDWLPDEVWLRNHQRLDLARAVIAAMREPTDEQRNAYFAIKRREGYDNISSVMVDAEWERMIDAVEEKQPA